MERYRFLTKREILSIHGEMVRRHGGTLNIWDEGKLEAAVEAPRSGFAGIRVHQTLWEVAAAYWFHISQAHAFESANKRTAVEACFIFLHLNGYKVIANHEEIIQVGLGVATGEITESKLSHWLRQHIVCI